MKSSTAKKSPKSKPAKKSPQSKPAKKSPQSKPASKPITKKAKPRPDIRELASRRATPQHAQWANEIIDPPQADSEVTSSAPDWHDGGAGETLRPGSIAERENTAAKLHTHEACLSELSRRILYIEQVLTKELKTGAFTR